MGKKKELGKMQTSQPLFAAQSVSELYLLQPQCVEGL